MIRMIVLTLLFASSLLAKEVRAVVMGYGVLMYNDQTWTFEEKREDSFTAITLANIAHTRAVSFFVDTKRAFSVERDFDGIEKLLKKRGDVQVLGKDKKDKEKGYVLAAKIMEEDKKTIWNTALVMQERKGQQALVMAYYATDGDPREDKELKDFYDQILYYQKTGQTR